MNQKSRGGHSPEKSSARGGLSQAMVFILLFGIVSLFSDMTHEGAASIRGAYLSLLGASAGTIGFVSGLGELTGYSLRLLFGRMTDKTGKYWPMVILGYVIDICAVPALALVGEHGWVAACGLLIIQKMGKAIKKPAKDTVMSFAASQEGAGKSFAIQELLDQIGAVLGPVFLYLIMLSRSGADTVRLYARCFAFLAIPGAVTVGLLLVTRRKFPNPADFEPTPKEYIPFRLKGAFILYIAGISLSAFGFLDYSLIVMHVSRIFTGAGTAAAGGFLTSESLPLLYAWGMLVDALAALIFGFLYDKRGVLALSLSAILTAPAALVFTGKSFGLVFLGVSLWGVGMGAQESILKAAVTTMVPKTSRATGYGIFEFSYGIFWFFGSWLLGTLYDVSVPAMVGVSACAELLSIIFYILSSRADRREAGGAPGR